MAKAGRIEIEIAKGGHPVWCRLIVGDQPLCSFDHRELSDLIYAAKKARHEALQELPASHRHEIMMEP